MGLLRRLAPLLVAVGAVTVTAGCVHTVVEVTINNDGSGSQRMDLAFERDFMAFLAGIAADWADESDIDVPDSADLTGVDFERMCRSLVAESSPVSPLAEAASRLSASHQSETDASACRTTVRIDWDADAAETILEELSAAAEGDSSLTRLPTGGWRFESASAFGEEVTGEGQFFVDWMEDSSVSRPTLTLSITLPGEPLQHNARRVSGSTFTWDIDVLDPGPGVFAETAPASPSPSPVQIVLIVVGAGAVLLILALMPWWLPRLRAVVRAVLFPESEPSEPSADP